MSALQDTQTRLTRWLRDPDTAPPGGIESRRLAIYRDLVFNNIEAFLAAGFPICKQLFSESEWSALVRQFLLEHRCQSPYFHQICAEFLRFLTGREPPDKPWLSELAHYEWVELELDIAAGEPFPGGVVRDGDLLTGIPVLASTLRPLSYHWPVHLLGPGNPAVERVPDGVYLLVYRDPDERVAFMELNAATARLLELLLQNQRVDAPVTGAEVIAALGAEMQHPDIEALQGFAAGLLDDMRQRGIVAGALMAR